ncbi:MAG: glycyl-radical enzyme activating protein [Anaerolineae bacterium CG2_30_58_95]|nr:MAG: glycyl-radical enzyme activating protein [Anaerolineae bacterium CG2_30_58_95]
MGLVFDIRKYSIHDGPGIRTTVFLKGCPLRCLWCHNPEGRAAGMEVIFHHNRCIRCGACLAECEHGAISWNGQVPLTDREKCEQCGACAEVCYAEARQVVGREMTVAQVVAEIERDIPFYDETGGGVTLSGGEPLAQRDFALALLKACKEREIHTALDTCGFASWDTFERVRGCVDLFLYDLKVINDDRHREFTGASNTLILNNLQKLSERDHLILLRMPVIPGVNDDEENIRQTGEFVASLPRAHSLELLPYHHAAASKYAGLGQEYPLPDTRPPSEERLGQIAEILRAYGVRVISP